MTKLVRTPVPGWTGDVGKVHFDNGEAVVGEDAQELSYFVSQGYQVDDLEDAVKALKDSEDGNSAEHAEELEDAEKTPVQGGAANPDAEPPEVRDVDNDGATEVLPRKNASAEEWRRFAVEHGGMSKDDADGKSRDELVEHFTAKEDEK